MDIEKKVAEARAKHGKPFVTEAPVQRMRKPSRELQRLNRLSAQAAGESPAAKPAPVAQLAKRRIAGGR